MATIHIPCPKCGKELKLRDRTLLGRKGRCPSCQHTFVLDEPDEVQLELAETAPAMGPLMGTAARWVPDGSPSSPMPSGSQAAPSSAPQSSGTSLPFGAGGASPAFGVGIEEPVVDRAREAARRRASRRRTGFMLGTAAAVIAVVAGLAVYALNSTPNRPAGGKGEVAGGIGAGGRAANGAEVETLEEGEPITLTMAPLGARFLINLRPAELWQKDSQGEEFRYCLGPVGEWLEAKIRDLTKFEPAEIEEILFCVIPNGQGDPASFAGVVRLKEEHKRSEMITKFQGAPKNDAQYPVYVGATWAYAMAPDNKKMFAFCPAASVDEMVSAIAEPSSTDPEIEELLRQTDRSRHLTIVFRPDDARLHHPVLLPENAGPFANQVIDWFNPDEIEAVAWSLHLGGKQMHSDVRIRNKKTRSIASLEKDYRRRLEELAGEALHMVEMMQPAAVGKRQVIGRLPAMLAVLANETELRPATRLLTLSTALPERAAPNLALGSLLAWDESTRTDFSGPKKPAGTKPPAGPTSAGDGLLAKLGQQIEIDFRKTPLQDAFKYIATETGATIDIDGDGLKLSGYTKNMEQNMQLGMVSGLAAMREIVAKYKDMCVLMDEQKKVAVVTTKAVAEKLGQTPFVFPK